MKHQWKNILWITAFAIMGGSLFAQSNCKEKLSDFNELDVQQLDTIKAYPEDASDWINKVMKVYRPGEFKIEQKVWEGDWKVYYFRKDGCLLIHRAEKYLPLKED